MRDMIKNVIMEINEIIVLLNGNSDILKYVYNRFTYYVKLDNLCYTLMDIKFKVTKYSKKKKY